MITPTDKLCPYAVFFFFFAALQDACLLGALEDGLNALLSIEVRMMQHLLGFMLAASLMIFAVIFIVFSSLNCATIIVLHDNVC